MQIAVIGGGVAGLTTALAFAKAGASVCVYEQAEALKEVGAGLQITPNGARALNALGVWPGIEARGVAAQAILPTNAVTGRRIARFDLARYDPGYLFIHRADLIDVLAHGARSAGANISLNARIDGTLPDADLIVGAEGVQSGIRAQLNGAADPFFTGQVAWRATILGESPPEARLWMAPGRHVVTYPLRGGRINVVAVQERDVWAKEGWSHADHPESLREAFGDACPELAQILGQIEAVNLWGLFRHPVADRWHDGRVALVGDAAHPTLPFLAQGANLAIEDAYTLASMVATHGVSKGLPLYQKARKSRVQRAISAANANARNYHLSGVRRQMAHSVLGALGRVAPSVFLSRMNWLYGHDVTRNGIPAID